jgi:hypothetical protein
MSRHGRAARAKRARAAELLLSHTQVRRRPPAHTCKYEGKNPEDARHMREAFDRYARNRTPNLCGDRDGKAPEDKGAGRRKQRLQRKTVAQSSTVVKSSSKEQRLQRKTKEGARELDLPTAGVLYTHHSTIHPLDGCIESERGALHPLVGAQGSAFKF